MKWGSTSRGWVLNGLGGFSEGLEMTGRYRFESPAGTTLNGLLVAADKGSSDVRLGDTPKSSCNVRDGRPSSRNGLAVILGAIIRSALLRGPDIESLLVRVGA